MVGKRPRMISWMLKGGLLFGSLIFVLIILLQITLPFPALGRYLEAPANGLAWLWHESGLPPRGEAGFLLPTVFMLLQCFVIGALIGLWRYRKLRRTQSAPSTGNQAPVSRTKGE